MSNDATRAKAEGLPVKFRAAALARANQLASFVDKVMEPQRLETPDQRIDAAIEEIKLAYQEKWPSAPIYVRDLDQTTNGMIIIMTHVEKQAPGTVHHERAGTGWCARGGEARVKGGEA